MRAQVWCGTPDVLCIDNGKQMFDENPGYFENAAANWEALLTALDDTTETYIEHLREQQASSALFPDRVWSKLQGKGISENLPCWAPCGANLYPAKLINRFDPHIMSDSEWAAWVAHEASCDAVRQLRASLDKCLVRFYEDEKAAVVNSDDIKALVPGKTPANASKEGPWRRVQKEAEKAAKELQGNTKVWLDTCDHCRKVRRREEIETVSGQ